MKALLCDRTHSLSHPVTSGRKGGCNLKKDFGMKLKIHQGSENVDRRPRAWWVGLVAILMSWMPLREQAPAGGG
jgi:hypothetical protein